MIFNNQGYDSLVSERRQEDIDAMFKGATTSKIVIDKDSIQKMNKILAILDSTLQGQIALNYGIQLSRQYDAELFILVSDDSVEQFKLIIDSTVETVNGLVAKATELGEVNDKKPQIDVVLGQRIENTLQEFSRVQADDDLLGGRLVAKMIEIDPDLIILGTPLFHEREHRDSQPLGSYITQLLTTSKIRSNFLLLNENTKELPKSIISFVTVNQQPRSILALVYRMFSLVTKDTKVKVIGVVEDKTIETVARVEASDQDDESSALPIMEVTEKLRNSMSKTLESLVIEDDIPHQSLKTEVKTGSISSVLKTTLDELDETGMILVRSVTEARDNLDPVAVQVAQLTLGANHPCLIVWD